MKHNRRKVLQAEICPDSILNLAVYSGVDLKWRRFVSGKRKLQVVISFGALLLSARLPLAAQVSSQSPVVTISSPSPIGDTTALAKEAQGWLIDLIRTNTTNPPGNEQATAKYLAHILEKEGIQSEQLDLAPGRSALVARLRSSAMADPSKALLLVAHMDVVGVDRSKWTVDPFAAMIKDGYLYGLYRAETLQRALEPRRYFSGHRR
jgi:hypothetical protein